MCDGNNVVKLSFVERLPVSASKLKQRTLVDRVEEVREKSRKQGFTKFFIRHNKTDTSAAETPTAGLPASADDLKIIAVLVNVFMEQIINVKALERAQTFVVVCV